MLSNNKNALNALSPLDGRYSSQLDNLANLFSEFSLIQSRVQVEIEYILFLSDQKIIPQFTVPQKNKLLSLSKNFSQKNAEEIKKIEQKVHHDVKAVEYFLRDFFKKNKLPNSHYIHFALTSEDTNSLAYGVMLQIAKDAVITPALITLLTKIAEMAEQLSDAAMLAKTHGQSAVPTTMGKELVVFAQRFYEELTILDSINIQGKLTGAVGNYNAHKAALDMHDWPALSSAFIRSLGLAPQTATTQIVSAESYTRFFSSLLRINLILIDLNQDIWRYISDGVFLQKQKKEEVGSSTMPQKVNPIDFENSEGNLGLANALLQFFITKLPISRLQRDLSDSTVKRNFGAALGYCVLAYNSTLKGLQKLSFNSTKTQADLDDHWEIVAEGVQVVLKHHGVEDAYEQLKEFCRGSQLCRTDFEEFISKSDFPPHVSEQLLNITPFSYSGYASDLTKAHITSITSYLKGKNGSTKNKKK